MFTPRTYQTLAAVGLFLLPLIIIRASALVLADSGPNQAVADTTARIAAPALIATFQPPAPSPESLSAAAWVDALRRQAFGPNPFYYSPSIAKPTRPAPTTRGTAITDLPVQAIMSADGTNVAVINDKTYRLGDRVAQTDWQVLWINSNDRSVMLGNTQTGQQILRRVESPQSAND